MSKIVEELCQEYAEAAVKEAAKEAAKDKAIRTARKMLADHKLSLEDIAAYCELTLEEVQELDEKQPA